MNLQFIALVVLTVARSSLANGMRESKIHQHKGHCVPEGVFSCTVVGTIYNVAEAKFEKLNLEAKSTYRSTLEDGTSLAPGHFLVEHPSSLEENQVEINICALNPAIEGTAKCADISDSSVYELKLNKDCTALEGIAYHTATATLFNEFPLVTTYHCEKKMI